MLAALIWSIASPASGADGAPPPTIDLAALVRTWLARDGVRATPDALRAAAAPLCAERPLACLVGGPIAVDPLAATCAAGDLLGCLAEAWASAPLASVGRDSAAVPDPVRYRSLVEQACAGGVVDGCVEVGALFGLGVGTYRSEKRASGILGPICARGYSRACTVLGVVGGEPNLVKLGAASGDPAALARSTNAADWQRACDAGHTGACVALADRESDRAAADAIYARACALGDPLGCVGQIRNGAVMGRLAAADAASALDQYCAVEQAACEDAAFLRQGATPILAYTGELTAAALERKMIAAHDLLFACYRSALEGDHSLAGTMSAVLRLEPTGKVSGVYLPDPFTPAYDACVTQSLLGFPMASPWGHGAARVPVTFAAQHTAKIGLRAVEVEDDAFAKRLFADLPRWERPAEQCFLDHDEPVAGVSLEVQLRLRRNGRMSHLRVLSTSDTAEVDDCVLQFLATRVVPGPSELPTNMIARFDFLTPRWEAPPVEPPSFRARRKQLPPVDVDTLVLLVARTTSPQGTSELSPAARNNIAAVHEQMAERIVEATDRLVRVHTVVRPLDTALTGARIVEVEPGVHQLEVDPEELTPALLAAIEPGEWDSVFVWAPAPVGAERADLGATLDRELVRGASISFLTIRGNVVSDPLGAPGALVPLHEWWHQIVARADRLLGVDIVANHDPVLVERDDPTTDDPLAPPVRETFDPRTWTEAGGRTAAKWYDHVMGELVQPELWADVWHFGERLPVDRTNVAYRAQVDSDSVLEPLGLNDGWIEAGGFANTPRVDPDAEDFWFGLRWDEPVEIRQIVAHVGRADAPSEPSFTEAPLDVILADDPTQWRSTSPACTLAGATLTCALEPVKVLGIRLRPATVDAVVREIEVR